MNREEAIVEIARRLLCLPTLDARNSDRLDFHELSVGQIRQALEAAWDAGFKAATDLTGLP
jgi:uncharacterized protein DUF6900